MGFTESKEEDTEPTTSQIQYPRYIKLLLVGGAYCGKSNLIQRYVDGNFSQDYVATIGVDFRVKSIKFDDSEVSLQIWEKGMT